MKEVIFTQSPYMNGSEKRIADMHSVLSILNVLVGELSLLTPRTQELSQQAKQLCEDLFEIAAQIREGAFLPETIQRIRDAEPLVMGLAEATLHAETLGVGKTAIQRAISNLQSVFSIISVRLNEFEFRSGDPGIWVLMAPELFQRQLEDFFTAVAVNAKGSYRICFDPAQQTRNDYYFDLEIDVQRSDGQLWIPLRLQDVVRDLAANARKYTHPGGRILLRLTQCERSILVEIEDNGCGIPGDEIEKVAEFGYRASNVQQRPTLGGGFGLTKAVWLVTGWGGSLTLRSEVDAGTLVRLSLPNAGLPASPVTWTGA